MSRAIASMKFFGDPFGLGKLPKSIST